MQNNLKGPITTDIVVNKNVGLKRNVIFVDPFFSRDSKSQNFYRNHHPNVLSNI